MRHAHVVNVADAKVHEMSTGKHFACNDRHLGAEAGGRALGCSHYEVPPGRAAFPHHYHCANEEAIFVLAGEGTLRIGAERVAVRAGDYIALPVGPESAHQLINTGTATLTYLCFSTLIPVEVVGYPDSKKTAATAAASVAEAFAGKRWVRHIWKEGPSAGYYDGEPVDEEAR
jgi:uncharacterized cupin superfamily protein